MRKRVAVTGSSGFVGGAGTPSRDFLYVEDFAEAVLRAVKAPPQHRPINIGTGVETTIRDVVRMLKEKTGYKGGLSFDIRRPDGQPRRVLDTERARRCLGWVATTKLDVGLDKTLTWYYNNQWVNHE